MKRLVIAAVIVAAAAVLGYAVVRIAGFEHSIDRALPLWIGVAAVLATWPRRPGAMAVPLLLAAAIGIPDERLRHLAYGLVLALAFCTHLADSMRRGGIPAGRAALVLGLLVALRAVPLETGRIAALLLLALGAAVLARVLAVPELFESSPGIAVSPARLLVAGAIVWITPAAPLDAALVPLVVAILLVARTGNRVAMAAGLLLAIVVGRWVVAAGALAIAPAFASAWLGRRRAGAAAILVPPVPLGYARAAVAGVAFAPGALGGFLTMPAADRIAAALILGLSLFARPMPALLLALLALLLLLEHRERSGRSVAVPAAFGFALVAAMAWSGATAPAFPLLAEPVVWLAIASAGGIATLVSRGGALVAAAAAVAVIALTPAPPETVVPLARSLAPGEAFAVPAPRGARVVDVVLSGAHVSNATRDTPVAHVAFVDANGHGARREVRLRELADWGAFREGELFWTLNPLPRRTEWTIDGVGRAAMLRGEGRIRLRAEAPIRGIEVRASGTLPPNARVQLERFEVPAR